MAAIWASEIRLTDLSERIAGVSDVAERAKRIAAFVEQGFIEGAYRHYLDHKDKVDALSKVQVEAVRATLPQPVIDALRFYAHGHHYNIDDDHQQFDTVSGEPQNWLFSERDDDCTMIEDGSIAKAVLLGGLLGFEEPTEPLEGEVFAAAASGGEKV
jgi:hypothetical protein